MYKKLFFFFAIIVASSCNRIGFHTDTRCDYDRLRLLCYNGQINIIQVKYGRWKSNSCGLGADIQCYSSNADTEVRKRCHGRAQCTIDVSPDLFDNPCPTTKKTLEVSWKCIDNPPFTAPEQKPPSISQSDSQNHRSQTAGYAPPAQRYSSHDSEYTTQPSASNQNQNQQYKADVPYGNQNNQRQANTPGYTYGYYQNNQCICPPPPS